MLPTTEEVLLPDSQKVKVIADLPPVTNLKRAQGMINYVGKYIPHLATIGGPLYELLKNSAARIWDHPQERAFESQTSPD